MANAINTDNHLAVMDRSFREEVNSLRETLPTAITSPTQYSQAQSALAWFAGMRKKIKAKYAPFKRSALDHLNLLRQGEKDDLAKCEPGEDVCNALINAWESEREAQAQEALDEAIAEAQKTAQAVRDQQLAFLDSQEASASEGDISAVRAVRTVLASKPLDITPKPVTEAYSRPSGHSTRVTYTAQVVDLLELVKAVAAGSVEVDCIQPNQPHLNARARREKGLMSIPGVEPVKSKRKTIVRMVADV